MGKAEKPKMKHRPKFTDKAQSERFIETARQLGVEETGEGLERAFEKIVPPKAPMPKQDGAHLHQISKPVSS